MQAADRKWLSVSTGQAGGFPANLFPVFYHGTSAVRRSVMRARTILLRVVLVSVVFSGLAGLGADLAAAAGVVRADFNGDGWADLAIGMHGKNVGEEGSAGAVVVIYGSSAGLDAFGGDGIPASQVWTQSSPGVPGGSEEGDEFGTALAAGDFNNDGFSDLAIGVPKEDVGGYPDLGAVNIVYGSAQGLATDGEETIIPAQFWALTQFQEIIDVLETSTSGYEHFGSALAVADFNGDGFDDLAIGIPDKNFMFPEWWWWVTVGRAGAALVLHGSKAGLTDTGYQLWHQGPLKGGREAGDQFGAALATGDFNGDGFGDLAVGVPYEDINGISDAGAVNVIYGSANGLTSAENQIWHKDSPGIIDRISSNEHFGQVLTAGDFNGDGRSDLAVGVPDHNLSSAATGAGSVSVIYGSPTGLTHVGNDILTQNRLFNRTVEQPGSNDHFGSALAAGDFNGDGKDDVAIGVPGEDVFSTQQASTVAAAGAVNVVYGSANGFVLRNGNGLRPQIWHQEKLGGILEVGDRFGSSLSASNFGRNRIVYGIPPQFVVTADLAIGVPNEDVWSNDLNRMIYNGGAVNVIYGSTGGLSVAPFPGPGASQIWMQGYDGVPGSSEWMNEFGVTVY